MISEPPVGGSFVFGVQHHSCDRRPVARRTGPPPSVTLPRLEAQLVPCAEFGVYQ